MFLLYCHLYCRFTLLLPSPSVVLWTWRLVIFSKFPWLSSISCCFCFDVVITNQKEKVVIWKTYSSTDCSIREKCHQILCKNVSETKNWRKCWIFLPRLKVVISSESQLYTGFLHWWLKNGQKCKLQALWKTTWWPCIAPVIWCSSVQINVQVVWWANDFDQGCAQQHV